MNSAARLVYDYYRERDPNDEALKRLETPVAAPVAAKARPAVARPAPMAAD